MHMHATRDIARPAAEVFEFFADATNNPKWQLGMVSFLQDGDNACTIIGQP